MDIKKLDKEKDKLIVLKALKKSGYTLQYTDEYGQPIVYTNKVPKKLFSCRVTKLDPSRKTPKQLLEKKR